MNYDKKEFVVCAAVWSKELELKKEISYCRSRNLDHGVVFAGLRHPHAMYTMVAVTGLRSVTYAEDAVGEHVQGFVTSKDRFVDRTEAMKIALAAGQVTEGETYSTSELFSEDLY